MTHEIEPTKEALQIPACAFHVAYFAGQQSRANHEILIFTNSSPNSHTQSLH